jgi:hypothetical protein
MQREELVVGTIGIVGIGLIVDVQHRFRAKDDARSGNRSAAGKLICRCSVPSIPQNSPSVTDLVMELSRLRPGKIGYG